MKMVLVAVALAAACLSACTTPAASAAVTAAQVGEAVYCNGITEEARREVRNRLTGGVKVLPCRPPEVP